VRFPWKTPRASWRSRNAPEEQAKFINWNKRRVDFEKQMKTLRFKHFGSKEKIEIRQAGIAQLRTITDPPPSRMIEIMHDERQDVLDAVCQHLADLDTPESITTLAYAAIYEKRPSSAPRHQTPRRTHESEEAGPRRR